MLNNLSVAIYVSVTWDELTENRILIQTLAITQLSEANYKVLETTYRILSLENKKTKQELDGRYRPRLEDNSRHDYRWSFLRSLSALNKQKSTT